LFGRQRLIEMQVELRMANAQPAAESPAFIIRGRVPPQGPG
jgi:hypothetical protein